jgi:hypothetical protein
VSRKLSPQDWGVSCLSFSRVKISGNRNSLGGAFGPLHVPVVRRGDEVKVEPGDLLIKQAQFQFAPSSYKGFSGFSSLSLLGISRSILEFSRRKDLSP